MNPGQRGQHYMELPESLKPLFRPVAMITPDALTIARVLLLAEGFTCFDRLAVKLCLCFRLAADQLSKEQSHYDFGMRSLRTVISWMGKAAHFGAVVHRVRQGMGQTMSSGGDLSKADLVKEEETILQRALLQCTLPKLVGQDLPLFKKLLADLFPEHGSLPSLSSTVHKALADCVRTSLEARNMCAPESFVQKCLQLFDVMSLRHGVMLVGTPGAGKSACLQTLADAISQLSRSQQPLHGPCSVGAHSGGGHGSACRTESPTGQQASLPSWPFAEDLVLTYDVINPKAVDIDHLFGGINQKTHEWRDGIMAAIMRRNRGSRGTMSSTRSALGGEKCNGESCLKGFRDVHWVVLDGPVDPHWVESMNTMLDDSKTLCLASGERISLPPNRILSVIFEVEELCAASPATISRCGMVFVDAKDVGWRPLVSSWIKCLPDSLQARPYRTLLEGLFDRCLPACLDFVGHPDTDPELVGSKQQPEMGSAHKQWLYGYLMPVTLVQGLLRLMEASLRNAGAWENKFSVRDSQSRDSKLEGDSAVTGAASIRGKGGSCITTNRESALLSPGGSTACVSRPVGRSTASGMLSPEEETQGGGIGRANTHGDRELSSCTDDGAALGIAMHPWMHSRDRKNRPVSMWQRQARDLVSWRRLHLSRLNNKAADLFGSCGGRSVRESGLRWDGQGGGATVVPSWEEEDWVGDPVVEGGNWERQQNEWSGSRPKDADDPRGIKAAIASSFLFSLAWSIGGMLSTDASRCGFDRVVQSTAGTDIIRLTGLPEEVGTVFDYYYDTAACVWRRWEDMASHGLGCYHLGSEKVAMWPGKDRLEQEGVGGKFNKFSDRRGGVRLQELIREKRWIADCHVNEEMEALGSDLVVPTAAFTRNEVLISCLLRCNRPVLLCGSVGSGKSIVVSHTLGKLQAAGKCDTLNVRLGAASTPRSIHSTVTHHLEMRRRGVLGPCRHRRMVVFIDDLDMPMADQWGQVPILELLRQMVEHGGYFPIPCGVLFTQVEGLCHVASMRGFRLRRSYHRSGVGPPSRAAHPEETAGAVGFARGNFGLGRRPLAMTGVARLIRHYNVLMFPEQSGSALQTIFSVILEARCCDLAPDTRRLVQPIGRASTEVFVCVRQALLPTPAKAHYVFTPRDLFHLLKGLLCATLDKTITRGQLLRLWLHECHRTFSDRLVSDEDRNVFQSALRAAVVSQFGALEAVNEETSIAPPPINAHVFGHYTRTMNADGSVQAISSYTEVNDVPRWISTMESQLTGYSVEKGYCIPLVLFPEAAEHLSRLLRVFRMPSGHAMLPGLSGSGRRCLVKLAAHIMGYDLLEVDVHRAYGPNEWAQDLQAVLKIAGLGRQPIVLLFLLDHNWNEHESFEKFLENLDQLLLTTEVHELLDTDQRYYVQQELQRLEEADTGPLALEIESGKEREEYLNSQFSRRVKAQLHIAICVSTGGSGGAGVRRMLHTYRSFLSCCTFDWYGNWSTTALKAVARAKFTEDSRLSDLTETQIDGLVNACSAVHLCAEKEAGCYSQEHGKYGSMFVTSKTALSSSASYLEMMGILGCLVENKGKEVRVMSQRLEGGANKLRSTAKLVTAMQKDLENLLDRKESTGEEMERLIASIAAEQKEMDQIIAKVRADEENAKAEAAKHQRLAEEAQQDVNDVVPQVRKAIKELSSLNKKDISEIKSLTKPPPRLIIVLEALCIILRKDPRRVRVPHADNPNKMETIEDYWPVARELLSQVNFVQMLLSFEKDEMDDIIVDKLKPYMENPRFQPDQVGRISMACKSICTWIRAMYNYHSARTHKMIPRVERLEEAKKELVVAQNALEDKHKKLSEIEESLAHLKARYEFARASKQSLLRQAEESVVKIERATRLIKRLEGEHKRWESQMESLRAMRDGLVGDSLLAAAYISYLGAFPAAFRSHMLASWKQALQFANLPFSSAFTLVPFFLKPDEVRKWVAATLPSDNHSLENGIMTWNCLRPCLVLDPQMLATNWIHTIRAQQGVLVDVEAHNVQLKDVCLSSMAKGQWLFVRHVGAVLPPDLLPIIHTGSIAAGNSLRAQDGEVGTVNMSMSLPNGARVAKASGFKCIISSLDVGSRNLEEAGTSINLVDFTVNLDGLYSQLLTLVVEKERPDLEERKTQLLQQHLAYDRQLKETEDRVLMLLSNTTGTILDDEALDQALLSAAATFESIQGPC
ncbi:hypothetical protein CBR_g4417 [Chara braunii]|uniref:AAA+ ATPase domain-containing protein n=1 Tax=Chara braunii TaxID=69332 RepID=A0A388KHQ3_CHABU|nr:hypothetical protein CBR_g4417 [Chara braunii]|eukprot:GBG69585.1 hypothetical protein CBR_g4417 [Chara braunii]